MSLVSIKIKARLKHGGNLYDKVNKDIRAIQNISGPALKEIGSNAGKYMASIIRNSQKSKTSGGLADYFENAESSIRKYKDSFSVSVGNISELKADYPYWAMLNYGGSLMLDQRRSSNFVPGYWRGDQFIYTPKSRRGRGLRLSDSSIIAPLNYIQKTSTWVSGEINRVWLKYFKGRKKSGYWTGL